MTHRRAPINRGMTAALIVVATFGHAQGQWHYFYFHEAQPLTLDLTRVALFEREPADAEAIGAQRAALTEALASAGIAPEDVQPAAFNRMLLAATPASVQDQTDVRTLVASLAESDEFDFVSPVFLDARGEPLMILRHVHVGFDDSVSAEQAEAILAQFNAGAVEARDWARMRGVYRIRATSRDGFSVLETANAIARLPGVRFAEPDMVLTAHTNLIPNDPIFPQQWGLHNTGQSGGVADMDVDAPEAWDITLGNPDIITVVLDIGVHQTHPDINQIPGFDATGSGTGGGPANACDGHGTLVAGTISAIIDNDLGVSGVAPNTKTASAKWGTSVATEPPCGTSFSGSTSQLVASLDWAQSIGARLTNSSFSMGPSSTVSTKYDTTRDAGLIHFAAAGNSGAGSISYPSSLGSVNSIAALNRTGNKASFSQFGPGLAFSAPGEAIWTTSGATGEPGFASVSGTSFASPMAAGVAAMTLAVDPDMTPVEVEELMQETAVDLGTAGYDTTFGWGFVNVAEALSRLLPFEITFPVGAPKFLFPDRPTSFLVQTIDRFSTPDSDTATLHYAVDGGAFETVPLTFLGSGNYEATLPGFPFGSIVDFFVTIEAVVGRTVSLPEEAPQAAERAFAAAGASLVFDDDFEIDKGWAVQNGPGLTEGAWERGVPAGLGDRGDPTECFLGSMCYLTDNRAGGSDVDGGATTLISPVFDLAGAEEGLLSYARWYRNDVGGGAGTDFWVVEITDDGVNWVTLENTNNSSEWVQKVFRVGDFVSLTDQIQVRFTASDFGTASVVEAAVDAIEVLNITSTTKCFPASAPLPETNVAAKNRYLAFRGANSGLQTAIRVEFISLPGAYAVFNGTQMWVGEPKPVSLAPNRSFNDPVEEGEPHVLAAPLQCEPFFTDFASLGDVFVHHPNIVPGADFVLRAVEASCDVDFAASFSSAFVVPTSRFGDVAGAFSTETQAWMPPDGNVQVSTDVLATLDALLGRPVAPVKPRADLAGFNSAAVDGAIRIGDVLLAIDGALGRAFAFSPGPAPCP